MSPVLSVIVQALPDHLHNLSHRHRVVREVGDLGHQGGRGTPLVIGGRLAHLFLQSKEGEVSEALLFIRRR